MPPAPHPTSEYLARGWPVFPCRAAQGKGAKAPHLPGESAPGANDGGHWLASADPAIVAGWWRRWPDALIGLPTGLRSGTVVIDLDPKGAEAEAMLEALAAWCGGLAHLDRETGEVIAPAVSRTQSGGLHIWFAYPSPATLEAIGQALERRGANWLGRIENPVGVLRRFVEAGEAPEELRHCDVRAEGGYVIAPPSIMSDGRRYIWIMPPGEALPPVPRRLLEVVTRLRRTERERREEEERRRNAARTRAAPVSDSRAAKFVAACVRNALGRMRGASAERHHAILRAALVLGRFVRGNCLSRGEAEQLLIGHLPAGVSSGERKALATIRYGLDGGRDPSRMPAWTPDMLEDRAGYRGHAA
jgi:hypothetical protein